MYGTMWASSPTIYKLLYFERHIYFYSGKILAMISAPFRRRLLMRQTAIQTGRSYPGSRPFLLFCLWFHRTQTPPFLFYCYFDGVVLQIRVLFSLFIVLFFRKPCADKHFSDNYQKKPEQSIPNKVCESER